jgi:antitoxin (DNA-binding transcriptional repressor) of toxin-antitoxin stability system
VAEHTAGIGQLRGAVTYYVGLVASGDTVLVLRRGKPVAKMYGPRQVMPRDENLCGCTSTNRPHRASVAVLRSRIARIFDDIAEGQAVEVVRRGRSVAHICGVIG